MLPYLQVFVSQHADVRPEGDICRPDPPESSVRMHFFLQILLSAFLSMLGTNMSLCFFLFQFVVML